MSNEVLEVVIYDIKSEFVKSYRVNHLPKFRQLVESFDGLISYQTLMSCNDQNKHIDLVKWQDLSSATKAAEMVKTIQQADEFKEYLEAFEDVSIFHHFKPMKN